MSRQGGLSLPQLHASLLPKHWKFRDRSLTTLKATMKIVFIFFALHFAIQSLTVSA